MNEQFGCDVYKRENVYVIREKNRNISGTLRIVSITFGPAPSIIFEERADRLSTEDITALLSVFDDDIMMTQTDFCGD